MQGRDPVKEEAAEQAGEHAHRRRKPRWQATQREPAGDRPPAGYDERTCG